MNLFSHDLEFGVSKVRCVGKTAAGLSVQVKGPICLSFHVDFSSWCQVVSRTQRCRKEVVVGEALGTLPKLCCSGVTTFLKCHDWEWSIRVLPKVVCDLSLKR